MDMKKQVGAAGLPPAAALDSEEPPGVVDRTKAVQAVLDFDMEGLLGVVDTPLAAQLAVLAKQVVADIDTACD